MLSTNDIFLRPAEPEDVSWFYIWENDSEQWNTTTLTTPVGKSVLTDLIYHSKNDIFIDRQLRLVIAEKNNKQPVGTVDFFEFEPNAMRSGIGIYIDSSQRRKGYATQAIRLAKTFAFSQLHLHQLVAHVGLTNTISLKLFKSLGFVSSGILKDWIKINQNHYESVSVLQCLYTD